MKNWTMLLACVIATIVAFLCPSGSIALASEKEVIVLLDQGHGQHFSFKGRRALDLSRFRSEIERAGGTTRILRGRFSQKGLQGVEAVVISGAFKPLRPEEIDALMAFLKRGGRIFIALHIGPPLYGILDRLGVSVSNGVIREREHVIGSKGLDFMVVDLGPWRILRDLGHFNVYGCWALHPTGSGFRSVARTSPSAWVDLNGNRRLDRRDAVSRFSVALHGRHGKGEVVVFGDDAIFQNTFLKGQNLELARRISKWLIEGTRAHRNLDGFI